MREVFMKSSQVACYEPFTFKKKLSISIPIKADQG